MQVIMCHTCGKRFAIDQSANIPVEDSLYYHIVAEGHDEYAVRDWVPDQTIYYAESQ